MRLSAHGRSDKQFRNPSGHSPGPPPDRALSPKLARSAFPLLMVARDSAHSFRIKAHAMTLSDASVLSLALRLSSALSGAADRRGDSALKGRRFRCWREQARRSFGRQRREPCRPATESPYEPIEAVMVAVAAKLPSDCAIAGRQWPAANKRRIGRTRLVFIAQSNQKFVSLKTPSVVAA